MIKMIIELVVVLISMAFVWFLGYAIGKNDCDLREYRKGLDDGIEIGKMVCDCCPIRDEKAEELT